VSKSQLELMAAFAASVVLAAGAIGWLAERDLRGREQAELVASLEREAELTRELARGRALAPEHRRELDALADAAGAAGGVRVTLLAPDGTVVGDSQVPTERLPDVERHGDRPEVQAALAGRLGIEHRRSETVGDALVYVAVPVDGGRGGAVRVSGADGGAEAAVAALRRRVAFGAGLGLLVALPLAAWFSRRTLGPLREIRRLTEAVAAGELGSRPRGPFGGEIDPIARSIRGLAEQLRERLHDATQEKERLQAVLDGMTEGVLVIDARASIVLANDRLRESFGVAGSLIGKTVLEGLRNAQLAELIVAAQRSHAPVARAITVIHPVNRTFRVHAVRFPAGTGQPFGVVAVFHDVTELTQLETMRREFVANASHELRTPLAAIRGFAETLLGSRDLSEPDRRSYLEVIDRHSRRLSVLVDDLLELSKVESGKAQLSLDPVDVAGLVRSLVRENRTRFEEKNLAISHEVEGPSVARADTTALEQILTNLLDNAVKYTEPGGRIHVRIAGDRERVRIDVEDTGIGIPEQDLGRIFERFYRVDKARSRALGGTGLGLAIVKHLTQSMGGEISVQSEVGKGSVFSLSLPRGEA
jgi:two-component system phosphate regulon sensor histidine kinase PhoR